jgi:integrase
MERFFKDLKTLQTQTKDREVLHIGSLNKAHERVIEKNFPNDPFTIYTFRHTYGTRHSQAGTELPVLAELMGHSNIQTTMIYVHGSPPAEDRGHGEAASLR